MSELRLKLKNATISDIQTTSKTVHEFSDTFSPDNRYPVLDFTIMLASGLKITIGSESGHNMLDADILTDFDELKLIPLILNVFAAPDLDQQTIGQVISRLLAKLNAHHGIITVTNKDISHKFYIIDAHLLASPKLIDDPTYILNYLRSYHEPSMYQQQANLYRVSETIDQLCVPTKYHHVAIKTRGLIVIPREWQNKTVTEIVNLIAYTKPVYRMRVTKHNALITPFYCYTNFKRGTTERQIIFSRHEREFIIRDQKRNLIAIATDVFENQLLKRLQQKPQVDFIRDDNAQKLPVHHLTITQEYSRKDF